MLFLLPVAFAISLAVGCLVTFTIAIAKDHLTAYVPPVSGTGNELPESNIFSLVLFSSSFFGILCVLLRHMILAQIYFIASINKVCQVLNLIATFCGLLAFTGMAVVGSFSLKNGENVHRIGASILFSCLCGYQIIQSVLTLIMYRGKFASDSLFMVRFRILIATATLVSAILFGVLYLIQYDEPDVDSIWKEPGDRMFVLLVVAESAEWFQGLMYVMFMLTFMPDFGHVQVCVSLRKTQPQQQSLPPSFSSGLWQVDMVHVNSSRAPVRSNAG